MKSKYFIPCCMGIGVIMMTACNNSSSPNSSLTTKDTNVVSTDHTKNGNDTSTMDNVKPKVPVADSIRR